MTTMSHDGWNPALARQAKLAPDVTSYTSRDAIIYALGIGATRADLNLVYEGDDDFGVFPTFVVNAGLRANMLTAVPGIELDVSHVLHGEHYVEVFEALRAEDTLTSHCKIVDVLDKGAGKGAVIISNIESYDQNNKLIAINQFATFQVGAGGFNGPKSTAGQKECIPVPARAPDVTVEQKTCYDQPALYRMSGDLNPLHIDASFASIMGFKEPILHGLCTFGHSARHVIKAVVDGDFKKFRAIKVRFSKPVMPGQTLVTEIWRANAPTRVHFQTRCKETGNIVISNAYMDFTEPVRVDAAASAKL